ncbi:MAG: Txe/YoeB family addiction module toxin [Rickettsia endosymbiont of Culicoides impunctatus]|uniref:Txe/YoeB family addiction module toxin n=1 Tax=unclassified Candidatus Tisiphia TaxID=2996318 RepID=UPI001E779597|nr:MAG: Txe/YoeB family addiction module toxin [Rickettsia endosymbiont of Culicoides impunctatus]
MEKLTIIWSSNAWSQLQFWKQHNLKITKRIQVLINNIEQTPYYGIGKPEALKHKLNGSWSRRIDQEHRLIYSFNQDINTIEIKSCKGHYKKE